MQTDFPAAGILWRQWSATVETELAARERPILLFVADPDPTVAPFLRAIFAAMPANARLRALLHDEFPALFLEAASIPDALKLLGAGSAYHLAVLSPYGLTPMVTFNVATGSTAALVAEIVAVLERLLPAWR